jgi:hypothetical protein
MLLMWHVYERGGGDFFEVALIEWIAICLHCIEGEALCLSAKCALAHVGVGGDDLVHMNDGLMRFREGVMEGAHQVVLQFAHVVLQL